jgi:hypothetical protein
MGTRKPWIRGAVTLTVVGGLAAAMIASPVGAALSKKTVKKIATKVANQVFDSKIGDYYTKGQIDQGFYTKAQIDQGFYTKAQIDQGATGCGTNDPAGEMVKAGSVCIDRYEVSVWSTPTGGTQYGISSDDYPCADNGQDCKGMIYARSVPGVTPSRYITWFQAQAALANSGKRLPTSAEWQMAVQGTPDPVGSPGTEDCNTFSSGPEPTGERASCVSDWGANDMVGNLWEWVADWVPHSTACGDWPAGYGDDIQCLAGADTTGAPGALIRGGYREDGPLAGAFAVYGGNHPSDSSDAVGFRGAR